MLKYYEIYFQNFTGDTVSVDIAVDITDVCNYMSCNIMTLDEDIIKAFIMHLFKLHRHYDTYHFAVPIDLLDINNEPIPFTEFLYSNKTYF